MQIEQMDAWVLQDYADGTLVKRQRLQPPRNQLSIEHPTLKKISSASYGIGLAK